MAARASHRRASADASTPRAAGGPQSQRPAQIARARLKAGAGGGCGARSGRGSSLVGGCGSHRRGRGRGGRGGRGRPTRRRRRRERLWREAEPGRARRGGGPRHDRSTRQGDQRWRQRGGTAARVEPTCGTDRMVGLAHHSVNRPPLPPPRCALRRPSVERAPVVQGLQELTLEREHAKAMIV